MLKKYHLELIVTVNTLLIIVLFSFEIYTYFAKTAMEVEKEIVFPQSSKEIDNDSDNTKTIIEEKNPITSSHAEIKGAVKNPGVYAVTSNTIINDIIVMAGGLTKNAYTNNINLSKKVTDEMVIYVYTKDEYKKANVPETKIITVEKECNCPTYEITSCVEEKSSVIETTDIEDKLSDSNDSYNKININTATKDELMSLSGVGEAKATSIIEYRQANGRFEHIEDIMNISGISEKIYAKIKDYITI